MSSCKLRWAATRWTSRSARRWFRCSMPSASATKLLTPEWATLWANVQVGKVPFYYMGRGGVVDPSAALAQYFETGASPRIGYSNPKVDELLSAERQAFDPAKRKKVARASDEPHHRRSAGAFSLASPAAVWHGQERRLPAAAERAHLRLEHESAVENGVMEYWSVGVMGHPHPDTPVSPTTPITPFPNSPALTLGRLHVRIRL